MKSAFSFLLFISFASSSNVFSQDTTITIAADQDTIYEVRIELECIEMNFADKAPTYPGGKIALDVFIENNIIYPEEALKQNEEGIVHVQFAINKNGSISDIQVVKSVSSLLDAEAIRLIKLMPEWLPAEKDGRPYRLRVELPISFQILD